ncbi:MAG: FAD-dependent oxidoreductase [Geminicoccaceae bacterium]
MAIFFAAGGHRYLDWQAVIRQRHAWQRWIADHAVEGVLAYVGLYVLATALSVPGAAALTLLAGSLFGLVGGVLIASFASTIGATLAMVTSRYLLRGVMQRRYAGAMAKINDGIERDGARYLFGLRLVPFVPFFAINLAMGLTQMRTVTFAWVSQLGMLPATVVYVNAGTQLASIEQVEDLFSGRLIAAFAALAALPFGTKLGQSWWSRRSVLRRWPRPQTLQYDLIVIGGGAAGLVTAYLAAMAKAKVALIERNAMGGECLNTGCVPSKALIRSARLAREGAQADRFGLSGRLTPDFSAVMARVHRVIARVAPHDSAERYRSLGVEVIQGDARVASPWSIVVAGRTLAARRLVIATGSEPAIPPIPGLDQIDLLTSDSLWSLTERPDRLLVVGGGAIGCELAQAFARLGCRVVVLEGAPRLVAREDGEVGAVLLDALSAEGIEVLTGVAIERFERRPDNSRVHLQDGRSFDFDRVLVATGRRPRTQGFGLEELGLLDDGRLVVDETLRTRIPTIFAAGDVIGQLQFTHAAGHYAWYAVMNALFGTLKLWSVNTRLFPVVIYTDPEIARVGLSETEARDRGIRYELTRYDLAELDRAIVDEANEGFVQVLTVPGKDRILGVTLVGARAGDMLTEWVLTMRNRLGLKAVLRTIHPYPGWMEANRAVAGKWRLAHAPKWAILLSGWWLKWRRR